MKAVILAGGLGLRVGPLTDPLTKVLLPVYDKPMITHVVETLVKGGAENIFIALDGRHPELVLEALEDGKKFNCSITYGYRKQTIGPLTTLLLAEKWVGTDNFVLMFGDSHFFVPLVFKAETAPHMFVMPLSGFDDDYKKYSQITLDQERVTAIIYKSESLQTGFIQTMCFVLPPDAFEKAKRLVKTDTRATNLPTEYIEEARMTYTMLPPKSYIDCGTISALHKAAEMRAKALHS